MSAFSTPYDAKAHTGRVLFFSLLDEEWPELKRSLFRCVWKPFCEACPPYPTGAASAPYGTAPVRTASGEFFVIPQAWFTYHDLCGSDDFGDLKQSFVTWTQSGLGV